MNKLNLQNLMIEYDKQTELLDKEKEKLVASEKLVGDLTKHLHEVGEQVFVFLKYVGDCLEILFFLLVSGTGGTCLNLNM